MTSRLTFPLVLLLICGCGEATGSRGGTAASCVPGATQSCTCSDGLQGGQICAADGLSWGACDCSGSTNPSTDAGVAPNPLPGDSGIGVDTGAGTGTGQTGTMTCAQIDSCMASCNQGDNACYDNCYSQGTASAQALMSAYDSCAASAESSTCTTQCASYGQTCGFCLDQACRAELAACFSVSIGTGTLTCSQMDSCMANCNQGDGACYFSCFYQGTANAQTLMSVYESCAVNAEVGVCAAQCASYNQQCWTCLDQACQLPLNACLSN